MSFRRLKKNLTGAGFLLLIMLAAGAGSAEDRGRPPTPVQPRGAEASPLNGALTFFGLPGLSGPDDQNLSTYDRPRRQQSQSVSDRYHRNPDGSYGRSSASSPGAGGFGLSDRLPREAISAGSGAFASWAEGWLGGYGKARVNFYVDFEGRLTGSADLLTPLYDSEGAAVFAQYGLRTMSGHRIIGNLGLGQRFFWGEDLALGYNLFLDQDFSRGHSRGGAGVEAWYDWLRLSANYYTPLSGWKESKDFDTWYVQERPARGWDARLTGYLPFYRNLAVNTAFERWSGDMAGAFGRDDHLSSDPKVWSAGLEWTPVPLLSVSADQRFSGGRNETQVGLTLNFNFDTPWEDQLRSEMVAEMRTVEGSRHDFVNRQYDMLLEYRAKPGRYHISVRPLGNNAFEITITDYFGQPVTGRPIRIGG